MNSQELSLDLSKETRLQQPIRIRQGDLEGTTIVARIYDGGVAATTTGLSAYFVMELPDREHYYRKQASLSGNVATVIIDEAEAASVAGMTDNAYFQLVGEGVIYSTSRFTVVVIKGAIDGHDTAETYDGYVEDWLEGQTASIGSTMSNAITAMNNAAGAAISDANAAASAASAAAADAEGRIEDAIDAIGDISELAVPLMSADTRGGAKLGDGLAVDDGTLHVGQLTKASTGVVYGQLASVTAKGHAEQFSTTGKNLLSIDTSANKYYCTVIKISDSEIILTATTNAAILIGTRYGSSGNAWQDSEGKLIDVLPSTQYTASFIGDNPLGMWLTFFDNDKLSISRTDEITSSLTLTTPSNAAYVLLQIAASTTVASGTSLKAKVQLELGSTATEYEPYTGGAPSPSPDYPQEIQVVRGRNLFDPSDLSSVVAGYSNQIKADVRGNTRYTLTIYGQTSASSRSIHYYDGSSWQLLASIATSVLINGYTFTAPTNATRVCINGIDCVNMFAQLTLGSTPQPYVPYGHVGMEVDHGYLDGQTRLCPFAGTWSQGGITVDIDGYGNIHVYGTCTARQYISIPLPAKQTFPSAGGYVHFRNDNKNSISYTWRYETTDIYGAWMVNGVNMVLSLENAAKGKDIDSLLIDVRVGTVDQWAAPTFESAGDTTANPMAFVSTTPIPLPQRGWVGGLPDGTSDELMIDSAGHVEWEMETGEVVLDGTTNAVIYNSVNSTFQKSILAMKTQSGQGIQFAGLSDRYIGTTSSSESDWSNKSSGVIGTRGTTSWLCIKETSYDNASDYNAWLSTHPVTVLYPLATPVTEECGYVDLPDIPSEATVSIPELEDLGLTFWVDGDGTIRAAMRDWYERAHSEYADRIQALEEAVAALVTQ